LLYSGNNIMNGEKLKKLKKSTYYDWPINECHGKLNLL